MRPFLSLQWTLRTQAFNKFGLLHVKHACWWFARFDWDPVAELRPAVGSGNGAPRTTNVFGCIAHADDLGIELEHERYCRQVSSYCNGTSFINSMHCSVSCCQLVTAGLSPREPKLPILCNTAANNCCEVYNFWVALILKPTFTVSLWDGELTLAASPKCKILPIVVNIIFQKSNLDWSQRRMLRSNRLANSLNTVLLVPPQLPPSRIEAWVNS